MAWVKGYKGDYDEWAQVVDDPAFSGTEGWERIKRVSPNKLIYVSIKRY